VDNILPAYDDPLFSILIIVILILIVAVSSYVMGNIKEERKEKSLKHFLNRFNTEESPLEIEEMPFETTLIKPLKLLAFAFKNQGEYQKAINLNLYLIENIPDFQDKKEILTQLGQTYLKAGFLKRAEAIFLQILHKHARNKEALYYLGIVYEMLHEYDKALETLIPLKLLGEKTEHLEAHLRLNKLLNNKELKSEQKVEELLNLLENNSYDYRRIIKALFQFDLSSAWKNLKPSKVESILDILWFLPLSNLNFDIISSDKTLSTIFFAKGSLTLDENSEKNFVEKSNIFVIDTIVSAKRGGNHQVDINFSYGCSKCKQHFPISFTRCPQCYTIDAIQIKETVAKKRIQTGYSLL
jgi:lipopolysaccharide biosynthesis regulator YciM